MLIPEAQVIRVLAHTLRIPDTRFKKGNNHLVSYPNPMNDLGHYTSRKFFFLENSFSVRALSRPKLILMFPRQNHDFLATNFAQLCQFYFRIIFKQIRVFQDNPTSIRR